MPTKNTNDRRYRMTGFRHREGWLLYGEAIHRLLLSLIVICALVPGITEASIHHALEVTVHEGRGEIEVVDRVVLEGPTLFSLAATLKVRAEGGDLESRGELMPGIVDYRITPAGNGPVTLRYRGPLGSAKTDIFDMPRAVVDAEGVFLDASSAWYPLFRTESVTFDLTVRLPKGWTLVGQGRTRSDSRGRLRIVADSPQEDIYLLAGPYVVYAIEHQGRSLAVYLLQADGALAEQYLSFITGYLDFYERLVGPYAYDQFAVVENRWQTGYGMPGFTLLGSRVLRLPFLLKTSLPHEILHNWFGNGVYIDPSQGNWSEGLTAYLADYLIKEATGEGAESRRRLLARYTDFAADGRDVPVADFRSRHDDASQAVGYDKVQLLLHMLRQQVGDVAFIDGVRRFYSDQLFRRANFKDLLQSFRTEAFDPYAFYETWIERAGAPLLALRNASVTQVGKKYSLKLDVEQIQDGAPFGFSVPLYVTLEGEEQAQRKKMVLEDRVGSVSITFDKRPARVDLDPAFEVFRALSPLERPAALGQLFGAQRQWLAIPSEAPPEVQEAWRELADAWSRRFANVAVIPDTDVDDVPEGDALWILGWDNQALVQLGTRFNGQDQALTAEGVTIAGEPYDRSAHSVVLLDPDNTRSPLGFIGAEDVTVIRRLAGKLTHYGSFGRMVFDLPGLNNLRRDSLAVEHSPLSRIFDDKAQVLRLPPERILASRVGVALPE